MQLSLLQVTKPLMLAVLTSDMWASHGSSTDGVGSEVTGMPCAGDVNTWSKDVKTTSVVGERCTSVVSIGGTDGDGLKTLEIQIKH